MDPRPDPLAGPGPSAATRRLLAASLVLGPLCYLAVDCSYSVRGWWDGPTGAAHVLAAALYGVTALALVALVRGRTQAVLLVVALLGVVGNAGVGQDTIHVALGGNDLFQQGGPAILFKVVGFFFPLTFVVAALALRSVTPGWWTALLVVAAVLFPVAHVGNVSWLAVLDGVLMLGALGSLPRVLRRSEASDVPDAALVAP